MSILTKEKVKKLIQKVVESVQGIKATALIAEERLTPVLLSTEHNIVLLLNEMVELGDLVEVEYILPSIPYRVKSFLLPKGSKIGSITKLESTILTKQIESGKAS